MASKARSALRVSLAKAEQHLWEKYNKPNRNLFQALSAFEGNGVGRKVVRLIFDDVDCISGAEALGRKSIQGLLLYGDCNETKGIIVKEIVDMKHTMQGLHGRARGILIWKGQTTMDGKDRKIPNALKDTWRVLE